MLLPGEFFALSKMKESLESYESVACEFKSVILESVVSYENNVIIDGSLGDFSRYASKNFCCKSAVGPIQDSTGYFITEPEHKTDIFQKSVAE
jgi:hypothetical protein